MYHQHGVKMPQFAPRNVTILDRGPKSPRRFANLDEMVAMVRKYTGVEPNIVTFERVSFEYQLDVIAHTGVLITMHGAGLANEVLLPPGASVIEVFPVHVKHVLYERVAASLNLHHFKVYAKKFDKSFSHDAPYFEQHECDKLPTLKAPEKVRRRVACGMWRCRHRVARM